MNQLESIVKNQKLNGSFCDDTDTITKLLTVANASENDKDSITSSELIEIIIKLTSLESKEGGPYFLPEDRSQIDLGLNIVIAYFLKTQRIALPSLNELIYDAIRNDDFKSKYFLNENYLIYLVSKISKTRHRARLIRIIRNRMNSKENDYFDRLLLISSLLNLNHKKNLKKEIKGLIREKDQLDMEFDILEDNGEIVRTPLSTNYASYSNLLHSYRRTDTKIYINSKFLSMSMEEKSFLRKMLIFSKEMLGSYSAGFKEAAIDEIKRTILKNKNKEMFLTSFYFNKSLKNERNILPDDEIAKLESLNIFFWNSFIIYDNFWDQDKIQDPKLLPVANAYARLHYDSFSQIFRNDKVFFDDLMKKIDDSNLWEITNCRAKIFDSHLIIPTNIPDFGDYSNKFYPSSAHMLGSLAILSKLGYSLRSPQGMNTIDFFRNHLIARQICDDICDWEKDIKQGHLSTATALLISDWKKLFPKNNKINLCNDFNGLREVFWTKTIDKISKKLLFFTDQSYIAFKKIDIMKESVFFQKLIEENQKTAISAMKEREQFLSFVNQTKNRL